MFGTYLQLGFHHISDLSAYDHMLFILALCLGYTVKQWKQLAWLVTAFTIGHSITLALSVLNIFVANVAVIEFLIPTTILLTAVSNLYFKNTGSDRLKYGITTVFGCIHGMGFSNFLKMTLDKEDNLLMPLLSFNIGLEIGQLIILACTVLSIYVINKFFIKSERDIALFFNGGVCFMALQLMIQTKFW